MVNELFPPRARSNRGRRAAPQANAPLPRRRAIRKTAQTLLEAAPGGGQNPKARLTKAINEQWKAQWNRYAYEVPSRASKAIAKDSAWDGNLHKLRNGLTRPEATVATLLRTEHIGLNDYLSRRNVPEHPSPTCPCGNGKQTPKHILLFCPSHREGRQAMFRQAGTTDYRTLLTTTRGLQASSQFIIRTNLLAQFSLAREMMTESTERLEESGA